MAFVNSIRSYSEKKLIGYSREQLFDVVAAVENYHLFVPACRRSDVLQRSANHLKAKLEIGIPPLLEAYTSNVKLIRPKLVTASCIEGVLFKHLETRWRFNTPPKPYSPDQVCQLDFHVSFEFKTLLYAKLATPIFDEMVRLNVSAFLKRAHQLYGPQNKSYNQTNSASAPLNSDATEPSARVQLPVKEHEKTVVQTRSTSDRQITHLPAQDPRSESTSAQAFQQASDTSSDLAETNVKIKRCKHGRIIVKNRSRRRRDDELDASSQQQLKKDLVTDVEPFMGRLTKPCVPLEESNKRSSPLPAFTSSNIESKTDSTSEINASPTSNNNDSTHASHEPLASPSKSDKATLSPNAFKSTATRSSAPGMQTSRGSPRRSLASDDDSRRKNNKSRSSSQRARLRSSKHRGHRSRSPRHRDRTRTSPRQGSGSNKDRKAQTSSKLNRSNHNSPPPTESRSHRHSPRSHSTRRRRTRDRSRSRSRDSRRLYLHSRHSATKFHSANPDSDSPRRPDGSHKEPYKLGKSRNDYKSRDNVKKQAINITNTKLPSTPKSNSNQDLHISCSVGADHLFTQEPSHLKTSNQIVPKNQNLNPTHTVCPESSPHRTISAHSSMVLSSEEGNDSVAEDVASISSDIYDPGGPIISISPGDSPPNSSLQTANNLHTKHSTTSDRNEDDMPSSAVQLNQQEKYLQKLNRQERVVEEVKLALRPHYQKRSISKEQYKDVLRRAVPKICHSKNGEINPVKIRALVDAYVTKMRRRK